MKLRNRKTGEIANLESKGLLKSDNNNHIIVYPDGTLKYYAYNSLAELNAEWEDAPEEPKKYWYMNDGGRIKAMNDANDEEDVARKEIGNYFETEEEAEKAVEKLNAWKRLKDKGFRFTLIPGVGSLDIAPGKFQIEINAEMPEKWFCCDAVEKDLDLLFGGEE